MWIIYVYVIASIVLSISAGARAGVMVGVAFAAGSVLAVAVGGGLRTSLLGPIKQKVWGSVIAALLLALGLWVGTHFAATLFGVYVSGPMWVVIGAVVCFLFVDKKTLRDSSMSAQEAQEIVNAYGAAMEKPAVFPHKLMPHPDSETPIQRQIVDEVNSMIGRQSLRDIRTLPYPKERIKAALLLAIAVTPVGPAREQLKCGFVMLGDWQDANPRRDAPATRASVNNLGTIDFGIIRFAS